MQRRYYERRVGCSGGKVMKIKAIMEALKYLQLKQYTRAVIISD